MAKKKGGKKGGKKGKGKGDGKAKVVVETTKEMERERELLRRTGLPLGSRFSMKRRAESIRAEVASARLKTCMIKKGDALSLRGLCLEDTPEEFGWGVPPFEKMWLGLRALDLSHNSLFKTQETFDALACLGPHLASLDLSSNTLAGEVPASAGALVALKTLKVSQNQLTSIHADAAAGWGELTALAMNRNELVALPATTGAWSKLKTIDVRANVLAALEEESCSTWTQVEVVKMGGNKLGSLPPGGVGAWSELRSLYVTDNKIVDLPLALANCSKLEVLHCGVNLVKDVPAELFGEGGSFKKLRMLELYRNKVAVLPDDFGASLPVVEQLSLSGNAIKSLPIGLNKCVQLKELHLANNAKLGKVTEEGLGLLRELTYVNLAGCVGIKALPVPLATAWPNLREIDIRSGAKKEKCKLTLEWVEASQKQGYLIRGGLPPKKGKGRKK